MKALYFLMAVAILYSCDDDSSSTDPSDTTIKDLYINEVMADNASYPDDNDDNDDWIEIYNAGDEAVDLGGLFITDDLDDPGMYMIPETNSELTTIQPGGYLVLWADKESEQGVLHIDMKLSKEGEAVGLYQKSGTSYNKIDAITFPALGEDVSYGRVPDGSSNLTTTTAPTLGTTNGE